MKDYNFRFAKTLMLAAVLLILAGCETTIKIETPLVNSAGTVQVDNKGKTIYATQKLSETAFLAMQNTQAVSAMGEAEDVCAGLLPENLGGLTEAGEVAVGRALEMCQIRTMVAAAMGRATTAQGQIAAENTKAMVAIEQGQATKAKAGYGMGAIGLGMYFTADIFSSAFSAAGSNYTLGDVNMSNSGTSSSAGGEEGAGGDGQSGDRNMGLAIGGSTSNQSGLSNTQATGEKSTSVDNPIINGGPNNSVVNDADANGNEGRLF